VSDVYSEEGGACERPEPPKKVMINGWKPTKVAMAGRWKGKSFDHNLLILLCGQ
jgi:hypothetical protein